MLTGMQISWEPVVEGVWTTVTQPDDANVVLVAGTEHAMLVDAGGTAAVGAAVLASARDLSPVPVDTVVITHHHHDHWHGVAGMDGVEVIGHETLLELAHDHAIGPHTTFSVIHPLDLGDCFVELVHFGPAHTQSDVIVNVTAKGVICVGDLLEEEPQMDETSAPDKWPSVLDSVIGSSTASTVFIPGHGAPGNREDVALCGGKLGYMYGMVEDMVRRGVQPDDLHDELEEWPFEESTVKAMLPHMVADLAKRDIVARKQLPIRGI